MVYYTCDICGKRMESGTDLHYIVKMEVYAAYDPLEITEEDLERDYLDEISNLIDRMRTTDEEELEDQVYKCLKFDLCPACQRRFLLNPLPTDSRSSTNFSEN